MTACIHFFAYIYSSILHVNFVPLQFLHNFLQFLGTRALKIFLYKIPISIDIEHISVTIFGSNYTGTK